MMNEAFDELESIESYIESDRWKNISRRYSSNDIKKLRAPFETISPISKTGAEKLWSLLNRDDQFISGLVRYSSQALQMST